MTTPPTPTDALRLIRQEVQELRDTTPIVMQRKHFDRILTAITALEAEQKWRMPDGRPIFGEGSPHDVGEYLAALEADQMVVDVDALYCGIVTKIEKARPGETFTPLWWASVFANAIRSYLRPATTPLATIGSGKNDMNAAPESIQPQVDKLVENLNTMGYPAAAGEPWRYTAKVEDGAGRIAKDFASGKHKVDIVYVGTNDSDDWSESDRENLVEDMTAALRDCMQEMPTTCNAWRQAKRLIERRKGK